MSDLRKLVCERRILQLPKTWQTNAKYGGYVLDWEHVVRDSKAKGVLRSPSGATDLIDGKLKQVAGEEVIVGATGRSPLVT